jgi:hypothetical protein
VSLSFRVSEFQFRITSVIKGFGVHGPEASRVILTETVILHDPEASRVILTERVMLHDPGASTRLASAWKRNRTRYSRGRPAPAPERGRQTSRLNLS